MWSGVEFPRLFGRSEFWKAGEELTVLRALTDPGAFVCAEQRVTT